jgi:hypothetical protein
LSQLLVCIIAFPPFSPHFYVPSSLVKRTLPRYENVGGVFDHHQFTIVPARSLGVGLRPLLGGYRRSLPQIERPGRKADYPGACTVEVKNKSTVIVLPGPYTRCLWCAQGQSELLIAVVHFFSIGTTQKHNIIINRCITCLL